MKKKYLNISILFIVSILFIMQSALAQVKLPRASPNSRITQTVGIAEITVDYHRPGVKERKIWGGVVPYDQVWRAGANENTVITFSDDAMIEDKKIAAGTYGLHMLPTENEWTVIFSEMSTAWGSFSYKESEDVLRVQVKPQEAEYNELLTYEFMNKKDDSGMTVALHWEKLRIPFNVEFDTHEIVLKRANADLRGAPGFGAQGWAQVANYCLQNNINHEEALECIEKAISRQENFNNLRIKAGLLKQTGNEKESKEIMHKALGVADKEWMLNQYGYQLLGENKMDEAIKIFKLNVEKFPDAWNPHDSLGEAFAKIGDKKKAKKYYKIPLD